MQTAALRPEVPLALFKGMSDLERALFYIAQRDRTERTLSERSSLRNSGCSWSGMSGSAYTPKTYNQMLEEAQDKVARQALQVGVA